MNGIEEQKNLKLALKAEVRPLLVGLRNEIKDLGKGIDKLIAKEPPKIQKIKEVKPLEFPKSIEVGNFPKKIKAEVINPQEKVEVKGIKGLFGNLYNKIGQGNEGLLKGLIEKFDELRKSVLKVEVQNQTEIEFPDVQKVEVTNPPEQKQVQRVKIENSTPKEAVPVVLTTADRKRFYDMAVQFIGGGSGGSATGNLGSILAVLKKIDTNTDGLEVTLGDVDLNTDELEAKLDSLIGKDFATETTLSALKTIADAIKAQTDKLKFITDRLKVDATVTGITVVTDVRSLVQKLADADKAFSALGFNLTVPTNMEEDVFLITNPVGSGVTLKIKDFIINSVRASQSMALIVYRNPTITANGTAITPVNFRDISVAAKGKAFSLPTISNRGTRFELFGVAGGTELRHEEFIALQLLEGDSLLITVDAGNNNQDFSLQITFVEE